MSNEPSQIELFDFSKAAAFPPKSLDNLPDDDPLWEWSAARRRDALYGETDKTSADWNVRLAEYMHDTGAYVESYSPSNNARSVAEATGDNRLLARALLSHVRSEIATGAAKRARMHIDQLQEVAKTDPLPYLQGVTAFLEASYIMYAETSEIDSLHAPIVFANEAAAHFKACGEIDLAVLAMVEAANARARSGAYIAAVREVEAAMDYALANNSWRYTGRLLLMAAIAAADQGYRMHIEETTQKGILWCQFVGDFFGRITGIFALSRLISYMIPSGDPSAFPRPERYLRQALEEAKLHGASILVSHIETWYEWLYNKCGIENPRLKNPNAADEQTDGSRIENLVTQSTSVARTIDLRISARLQDGVEDSPDAFFVFDARRLDTGVCTDFLNEYRNGAGARMLGLGPGAVVMFSEVATNIHFDGLLEGMLQANDRREAYQDVHEIGEGEDRKWFRRRIVPSGDGVVLSLRDITAEREGEEKLRMAAELAQRAVRVQSEFIANMSHEIRTPINGVLGLARLLADAPLDPVYRSYVDDIIGSGDILLRVIGDVLDLSKIESDSFILDLAPVDLSELVASTVRLYHGQAAEKGLKLTHTFDSSAPTTVMADGPRVRQVLANLIGNAVKFTAAGTVSVLVYLAGGMVVIEVQDSGMGIPEERLGVVFDRFQQATPDSRMMGGTGLGLALARGIVELMGGSISAFSQPGVGSRFVVQLPLKPTTQRAAEVSAEIQARFAGREVLLVDDNRVNTIVSEHALTRLGCVVTVACDGKQALDALEKGKYDVVFMDVRMPVMDGLEATRELRRREAKSGRRTPVIALTAGALVEERDECFEAGMDDYITKPFTDDSLRTVLARWV